MSKRTAICLQLPVTDEGRVPEWMEVIPAADAAGMIHGADGRKWRFTSPQQVALNFSRPLAVDINHSTELAAPAGGESPAAGWMEALEVRDGALFAKVQWTERGLNALKSRDYRFVSPVFDFDAAGNVVKLVSAALVNKPNFNLALNSAATVEPFPMKQVLALLKLSESATEADAVAAITKLSADHQTALNAAQTPSLDRFVPRADHDAVLLRATNAEKSIADGNKAKRDAEIEGAIKEALTAGKIAPASQEFYRATCAQEGGLEKFKEFIKTAPPIVAPGAQVDGAPPKAGTALNAEQKSVAESLGIAEADFKKANNLA